MPVTFGGRYLALVMAAGSACFIDIAELGAPVDNGSAGAEPFLDCTGEACAGSCPGGTSCVGDGCCAITIVPTVCQSGILLSLGETFVWDGCGEPGDACLSSAVLALRTGEAPTPGARFRVRATASAQWSLCDSNGCGGACGATGAPWSYVDVAENTQFTLGVAEQCTPIEIAVGPDDADQPACPFGD